MVGDSKKNVRMLILDPHKTTQGSLEGLFPEASVLVVSHAAHAVEKAAEFQPDIVIMELSLAGHSGLEFLYEFRTYPDWEAVPVFIYSSLKVSEKIRNSRAWKQLNIARYFYKPESSLALLRSGVEKTGLIAL